jgi:small subunit ribosomal protein S1
MPDPGGSPRTCGRPVYPPEIFHEFRSYRIIRRTVRTEPDQLAKLKPGAIVKGTVVDVRNDVVVINAGLKSEGIVPIEQFRNDAGEIDVAVGDEVKVALDSLENGFGETVLSREKAKRAMVWDELEEGAGSQRHHHRPHQRQGQGRLHRRHQGRPRVPAGFAGRCAPGARPGYLEGKELEFKIIKLDRKRNNVVVSRRAVVESEHSEEREQLLEKLQEGAVVKGVVKNLTDYGAFVDLGGIDGLLHITDMAWKRVRHPSEVVKSARSSTCACSSSTASATASLA